MRISKYNITRAACQKRPLTFGESIEFARQGRILFSLLARASYLKCAMTSSRTPRIMTISGVLNHFFAV
eukprot:scaffold228840_cov15-Prasinocladus_malaysianus.AAC.1